MFADYNEALAAPKSAEQFAKAMQAICEDAGAERFLVLRLRGASLREVRQVTHSGGIEAASLLNAANSVAVHRLVLALPLAVLPSALIRPGAEHAIEVPGYEHGVAVLSRGHHVGCIVVFARRRFNIHSIVCFASTATLSSQKNGSNR